MTLAPLQWLCYHSLVISAESAHIKESEKVRVLLILQETSDDITVTHTTPGQVDVISIKEEPPDLMASVSNMGMPSTSAVDFPSRQQQIDDDDIIVIDSETTMKYLQGHTFCFILPSLYIVACQGYATVWFDKSNPHITVPMLIM